MNGPNNKIHVANRRRELKRKAVEYKGGKCEKCGYDKCLWAMHFHHKDPNQKDFNLTKNTRSWANMKREVDKCVLLCANCHAEEHEAIQAPKLKLVEKKGRIYKRKPRKKKNCLICNKEFSCKFSKDQKCCSMECAKKKMEKIKWPSREELEKMLEKNSFVAVGKKLGVSNTSVKRRFKNH